MKKSITLAAAAAVAVATIPSAQAAPIGYENASGFWIENTLNVSPFVDLSFSHDDNPHTAREYTIRQVKGMYSPDLPANERPIGNIYDKDNKIVESDSWSLKAGANLLLPGNHWQLKGRGFYLMENYTDEYVDDRTDWSEKLVLSGFTDAGTKWSLSELYQDIQYDDEFDISQSDRKELSLQGNVDAALTEKSHVMVGGFYRDRKYDDSRSELWNTLYDYSSYGGSLGFAHTLTEKTDWTIHAVYTLHDKEEYDSKASGLNGQIGLRTRTTEKLSFTTSVGAEYFKDFKYRTIDDQRYEEAEHEVGFTYNIAMNWKITQRLSLNVSGYADYEPAEDIEDNSLLANVIGAALTYRPGDHWTLKGGLAYRREDFNREVVEQLANDYNPYISVKENGDNRTDNEISAFANITFALNKYCSIHADWRFTTVDSSIWGYDYDRQRYGLGISLKY